MNGGFSSARWTAWRGCPVREWTKLVRERLGSLSLGPEREDEIIAELGAHLEDCVSEAVRNGRA